MPRWRVEVEGNDEILESLHRIERLLKHNLRVNVTQTERIQEMATDLSGLQSEVSENTDVTQSAVSLLNGLSQQLKNALANNDPAAVQAIVDQLDQNTASLAEAVAANTPAEGGGEGPSPEQLPA